MGKQFTLSASDSFKLGAYRADPAGTPKGGIVVIQEIFGVNQHIRKVCDDFAKEGYAAVAPALFDRTQPDFECGYTPPEIEKARTFVAKPDWDAMMRDTDAAIKELVDRPGRHRRLLHGRHHRLPRRDPAVGAERRGRLLRRPHRRLRRREAEVPGATALRREGCQHPDDRRRDHQAEAAATARSTSTRMAATASIATSAAASTRRAATWPGSAPRRSSPST